MSLVASNLELVRQQVSTAQQHFVNSVGDVKIIAVSKRQSIDKIKCAIAAGQVDFAESYLREALLKKTQLDTSLKWHFIGRLQSNKIIHIAENFDYVHSVSSIAQAKALSAARSVEKLPLKCFVQVKLEQEHTKAGVLPESLPDLLCAIERLEKLDLLGLMSLPPKTMVYQEQVNYCATVASLQNQMRTQGFLLPELSLGTSHDYIAAIKAGSTMVRLGTCIFGDRDN